MTRDEMAEKYAQGFMVTFPLNNEERDMNATIREAMTTHFLAGFEAAIEAAAKITDTYSYKYASDAIRSLSDQEKGGG